MDWRHQDLLTGVHNSASLDRVPQCLATFQGDHEHALSTGDSYGRALVHIAVGSRGAECSQIITFLAEVVCDINDCNNVWHAPPLVSSIYWNLHGMVSEHDACASRCAEARWTLESLGAKPLRFRDVNVARWRQLLRQAQKHLKSSGLEKQSAQLCEVHQWQNELAAVAARALPDPSTFQASQHFDRRDEQGKVRKVLRFWYVLDVQNPNLKFRKLSR